MGSRLIRKHNPSIGIRVFVAISTGIGIWMLVFPVTIRDHNALDWLDPLNLKWLGGWIVLVSTLQLMADAYLWLHIRALASCKLFALYVMFAVGNMWHDPTIAFVPYTGLAVFELLLALRRL